jgi:lipid-A-disaccharide synthase-like uncharacterized protein
MNQNIFKWVLLGFVGGALFGVAFGIIASVFKNGPTPLQGVSESWWWFAIIGSCIGFGHFRSTRRDHSILATKTFSHS